MDFSKVHDYCSSLGDDWVVPHIGCQAENDEIMSKTTQK